MSTLASLGQQAICRRYSMVSSLRFSMIVRRGGFKGNSHLFSAYQDSSIMYQRHLGIHEIQIRYGRGISAVETVNLRLNDFTFCHFRLLSAIVTNRHLLSLSSVVIDCHPLTTVADCHAMTLAAVHCHRLSSVGTKLRAQYFHI